MCTSTGTHPLATATWERTALIIRSFFKRELGSVGFWIPVHWGVLSINTKRHTGSF